MVNTVLCLILVLVLANIVCLVVLLYRVSRVSGGNAEQAVREELRQGREESAQAARDLREEVAETQRSASDTTIRMIRELSSAQQTQLENVVAQLKSLNDVSQKQLEGIQATVNAQLREIERGNERKLDEIRQTVESSANTTAKAARYLREEVNASLKATGDSVVKTIGELATLQQAQLNTVVAQLKSQSDTNQSSLDSFRLATDQRLRLLQENNEKRIEALRLTIDTALRATMDESGKDARQLREEMASALTQIRESNEKKLEEMRKTVDEQLQGTLDKRLGDSFSLVSERLEAVQRGLGEMQNLATGVGDLKRALTNVKTRGTWGEFQLGAILEQILNPDQYQANVRTNGNSQDVVEYAIRLPGRLDDPSSCVWLPIDSKFPLEDYRRLTEAAEAGNAEGVTASVAALASAVQLCAQTIREKYLDPPRTTDFAILFLPTEGLYGEVLRHPGLVERLQNTYRVTVAGPTTLAAILNSLRMGFRTLAIEQRASEVNVILGGVKQEFGKFGKVLCKVKSQLETAGNTIDKTLTRTRAMERQLRDVEQLPEAVSDELSLTEEVSESNDAEADYSELTSQSLG